MTDAICPNCVPLESLLNTNAGRQWVLCTAHEDELAFVHSRMQDPDVQAELAAHTKALLQAIETGPVVIEGEIVQQALPAGPAGRSDT